MEIKDKVVIITGASRGIGYSAAELLSRLGAKVVISARTEAPLRKLEKELPGSLAVVADVTKPEDVKRLISETVKKYGRVDILINNAGRGMYGYLETMDVNDYRKIMDVNVYGLIYAMQEVIPIMRKQGGGMIVNISSGLAKMHVPGISAYSATKHTVNAISFIARSELEKDGIIVSVVEPNMTATNFAKDALGQRPDFRGRQVPQIDPPEKVAQTIADIIKSEDAEVRVQ